MKNKKILVYGLGITGIASIKALSKLGYQISAFDNGEKKHLEKSLNKLYGYNYKLYATEDDIEWNSIDILLRSPGIPLDNPILVKARNHEINILSDLEMAYRIWGGDKLIIITGTNGKTTTTKLVSHILSYSGIKNKVVGNIGYGILWEIYQNGNDFFYITEASSFQLADIKEIKAKISSITNISPDHLDWHGSFEEYRDAKLNLFKNLGSQSIAIINKDDLSFNFLRGSLAQKYYISTKDEINDGLFYKDKSIIDGYSKKVYLTSDEIQLVGRHNMENIMIAIQIARNLHIDDRMIKKAIIDFKAVEHRLEFVAEIKGKKYYNDSKGTNVDSTINAIKSFDESIILIAGGYDKNVEFNQLFEDNQAIESLILYGENREKIRLAAENNKVKKIFMANNLEEAMNILKGNEFVSKIVLFSPASASWGQYKNFEERGKHFKSIVESWK